ncbi:Oleoyl-[acyl-carrier-protein] hydrolase [Handroanthus impetiginosus]|uniref:Acyl-[acyl-carrier-protein] hydrolase n=1 Tax=Handroanthus impetiginosus TaxID=429701 RepID=A0A2G9G768_9LAMI|nr:Oleoyl-[acyl-carrier-protein] hydrolase [Handroanthus impetiginosus]
MSSLSCPVAVFTQFSSNKEGQEQNKHKLHCLKFNGTKNSSPQKVDFISSQDHHIAAMTSVNPPENMKPQNRQKIRTKKQQVDPYRQGMIVEGVECRQTVVIRSYEVDPNKTATIESILNLLQETAFSHMWMSGLLSDGFGTTHGMMKNNLIWVVLRTRVQVDRHPIWGEIMEIDTWVGASGRNAMRRDWVLRSQATGLVFARATSTCLMMNQKTRRLSKIPDEVRAEILPWFIDKQAIVEESAEKIQKLDDNALYVAEDLKPRRSDLDMNHHVSNVKYATWMLEAIPNEFLENHQLSDIILEYKRECGISDVMQSLCEPQEDQNSLSSNRTLEGNRRLESSNRGQFSYTHLLKIKGKPGDKAILKGRTIWKEKLQASPFSP